MSSPEYEAAHAPAVTRLLHLVIATAQQEGAEAVKFLYDQSGFSVYHQRASQWDQVMTPPVDWMEPCLDRIRYASQTDPMDDIDDFRGTAVFTIAERVYSIACQGFRSPQELGIVMDIAQATWVEAPTDNDPS